MKFISLGTKSFRADIIEAITQYRNELTIHCSHSAYTISYSTVEDAQEAHVALLKLLENN